MSAWQRASAATDPFEVRYLGDRMQDVIEGWLPSIEMLEQQEHERVMQDREAA